jgi:hypothetical protein
MPALVAVLILLGLPLIAIAVVVLRLCAKQRLRAGFLESLDADLGLAGAERIGRGHYRLDGRVVRVQCSTNPLFSRDFTWRLSAYSDTFHEFELRPDSPVPSEFEAFKPLLAGMHSAGKMFVECYAAGPRPAAGFLETLRLLAKLAALPVAKTWRGGVFTIREGFERDVPPFHWRHDQRRKLPKETRRWCVSCWQGDAYLNGGLVRLLHALAAPARKFYFTLQPELDFLDHAYGPDPRHRPPLVEADSETLPVAADHYLDGEFMLSFFAGADPPAGVVGATRYEVHDRSLGELPRVRFYARRLLDFEAAWYGGEVEILSLEALPLRETLATVAAEFGAQVLEIDRRFHKRLVVPRE